jgi:hypothetical protein
MLQLAASLGAGIPVQPHLTFLGADEAGKDSRTHRSKTPAIFDHSLEARQLDNSVTGCVRTEATTHGSATAEIPQASQSGDAMSNTAEEMPGAIAEQVSLSAAEKILKAKLVGLRLLHVPFSSYARMT